MEVETQLEARGRAIQIHTPAVHMFLCEIPTENTEKRENMCF